MKVFPVQTIMMALISLVLPACDMSTEKPETLHRVTVITLQRQTVTHTQKYFCQINSQRHVEIRASETGYVEGINVKDGQTVKQDDLLLQVNYQKPSDHQVEAKGNADSAAAEVGSAAVKAPFDGVVDGLYCGPGSLFKKGDILTTLSDDRLVWARFDVPESRYLDYLANRQDEPKIELTLTNGSKFDQVGKLIGAIETDNSKNKGKISFRADFPNPDHLLRHGQFGNVLISRVLSDVIIIPQQAVLFIDEKRYVYVVDKNDVAHKTEILIQSELEDEFVVKSGVDVGDKIVIKSFPRIRDGVKVEYADPPPVKVDANQKYHG